MFNVNELKTEKYKKMSPPLYADLGKSARDVFGKNYHFGLLKLDLKTKTSSGVEFSTGGVSNQETGKVFGTLETKYKLKEYDSGPSNTGPSRQVDTTKKQKLDDRSPQKTPPASPCVTFTEKWNTDNILTTEVAVADFCQGAKVSVDTSFAPQTGDKSLRTKAEFKNQSAAINSDIDLKSGSPVINAAVVLGYNGWLAGYSTKFDSAKSKLTVNNFALGYSTGDFIIHTNVDDGHDFGGSVYQKVNDKLETAIQLAWSAGNNDTRFGIGCKYNLDDDASVRAKVNNTSQIGLSYSQKLREGVTLSLSALIDGKNFNEGGHKVGFSLELEA